jgi:hypothetical protein
VPEALGFFTITFPALKRWAFLFRPAGRDWLRIASYRSVIMPTSCRASESKNPSHRAPRARHKKAHRFNGGKGINMNPESPGDDTCRITEILNGRRAITGDTALRLAHFFGTSPEFWLNLQSLYEIRLAERKPGKSIKTLPTLRRADFARA